MAEARAKIADEGKVRSAGFLTASEIEPLSTAFRKLVGLDEIQGKFKFMKSKKALLKPRVALLDLMRNQYAVCGKHSLRETLLAQGCVFRSYFVATCLVSCGSPIVSFIFFLLRFFCSHPDSCSCWNVRMLP